MKSWVRHCGGGGGTTYVDGLDAARLRRRYADDAESGDTEQIEGGRADDRPGSEFAGSEAASDDLDTGQEDLRGAGAERHQRQIGHRVVPDLTRSPQQYRG